MESKFEQFFRKFISEAKGEEVEPRLQRPSRRLGGQLVDIPTSAEIKERKLMERVKKEDEASIIDFLAKYPKSYVKFSVIAASVDCNQAVLKAALSKLCKENKIFCKEGSSPASNAYMLK